MTRCLTEPGAFSTEDMRDLARNWPMYRTIDLKEGATVVIVGAFKGRLMEFMFEAFPTIRFMYGYEPQEWAHGDAIDRLREVGIAEDRWDVIPYGVFRTDSDKVPMYGYGTDECSTLPGTGRAHQIGTGSFACAQLEWKDLTCDLMVMNIEGYEWTLLPYLLEHDLLINTQQLAVQFHNFAEPGITVRADMWQTLGSEFPVMAYDSYPQWVYWRKT